MASYVALELIVFLLPLTMFSAQMSRAKIESMRDYSALAVLHNRLFDEKWVQGRHGEGRGPARRGGNIVTRGSRRRV